MTIKLFFLITINYLIYIKDANAQIQLPQLSAGQPVDTLIYSLTYNFDGSCIPLHEVAIEMDTNFIPVASGLEVYGIISGLSSPIDSVFTTEKGYLQNGDTIFFNQASSIYTFFSPWPGLITISLILSGTPVVPFELYPCDLFMMCTLGVCGNTCLLSASSSQCIVNDPSGTNENDGISIIKPYPNPGSDQFYFDIYSRDFAFSEFKLYDSNGKNVFNKHLSSNPHFFSIKTGQLKQGSYFYSFVKSGKIIDSGKIIIKPF